MMRRHPDALAADFRRYYNARVRDFGAGEAADLAANLPRESASMRALYPKCAWSDAEYMLWSIEYHLRALVYGFTEDARNGINHPRPLPNPHTESEYKALSASADFEAVAAALNINIGGDENG